MKMASTAALKFSFSMHKNNELGKLLNKQLNS